MKKCTKITILAVILFLTVGCENDKDNEGNHLPTVSIVNSNQTVNQGEKVNLSATAGDVDGDSLTYLWSIKSKPSESKAQLSSTNALETSFIADKGGEYKVLFKANDGFSDSKTVISTITVNAEEIQENNSSKSIDYVTQSDISNEIIGSWKFDYEKTRENNPHIDEKELNATIALMAITYAITLEEEELIYVFKSDHSIWIGEKKKTDDIWIFDDNSFYAVSKNNKRKKLDIEDNIMIFKDNDYKGILGDQESKKLFIYFVKIDSNKTY